MSLNESSLRKTREGKALFRRNKKDRNLFMGTKAILFICVYIFVGFYFRVSDMSSDLLKYLKYFHLQHSMRDGIECEDHCTNLKYEDVMAALLSLYADLVCVKARYYIAHQFIKDNHELQVPGKLV